jgi:hypothetical protein
LVHFFRFWYHVPRKNGNPVWDTKYIHNKNREIDSTACNIADMVYLVFTGPETQHIQVKMAVSIGKCAENRYITTVQYLAVHHFYGVQGPGAPIQSAYDIIKHNYKIKRLGTK